MGGPEAWVPHRDKLHQSDGVEDQLVTKEDTRLFLGHYFVGIVFETGVGYVVERFAQPDNHLLLQFL